MEATVSVAEVVLDGTHIEAAKEKGIVSNLNSM